MALQRIVELTLNNNRTPGQVLVKSLADFSAITPVWIEDDKSTVRLRFADPAAQVGSLATPVALEADNVIVLGGRKTRGAGVALFSATNFVKFEVPADEEAGTPADVYYDGRLNLNTGPMAAAFGSDQTVTVWVDVEVQAPDPLGGDDPDRTTFQFQVTVNRQAYDGDEAVADSDPVYPAPGLLALKSDLCPTAARTNATAQIGNDKRPFLTAQAAYNALTALTGGASVLKLGVGDFTIALTASYDTRVVIMGVSSYATTVQVNATRPNVGLNGAAGFSVASMASPIRVGAAALTYLADGGTGLDNATGNAGNGGNGGNVYAVGFGGAACIIQASGGNGGYCGITGFAGGNAGVGGDVSVSGFESASVYALGGAYGWSVDVPQPEGEPDFYVYNHNGDITAERCGRVLAHNDLINDFNVGSSTFRSCASVSANSTGDVNVFMSGYTDLTAITGTINNVGSYELTF
jgi:hypothetical protein